MKLSAWLSDKGVSDADFGAMIGRSRSAVSRLRREETQPDWETAAKIREATNGAVTPNDFLPEPSADASGEPSPFTEAAQ
jgi:transcriptional regulator with XRE-family HTH domain